MFGLGGKWAVVQDGRVGLLSRDGVFQRQLSPGRHWVRPRETLQPVTVAPQMLIVAGQEVASSDGFLPRLGAVVSYAVSDARKAVAARQTPYLETLTIETQLALRLLAAGRPAEDLARAPRAELDAVLLAAVQPGAQAVGLSVDSVRLRDVALPADLRRLLTGVEKARREGQATLERAHAEQAALRALANAARMLRNNPELQNLRLLQALGEGKSATIVLGAPSGLVPLRPGEPDLS